ncbi:MULTISPECIES: hypothetical protein [Listeria]|uniref:hypothetical protein n=1 Tax=Listeria TaxID=1637 RepID=UPI000B595BE3|nr:MULTISPECIES: hypothetical protein [Listeria]
MYKVIQAFSDKNDSKYIYEIGAEYPRKGAKKPTKTRLNELLGDKNALKSPIIEEQAEIDNE